MKKKSAKANSVQNHNSKNKILKSNFTFHKMWFLLKQCHQVVTKIRTARVWHFPPLGCGVP